jgi:hypothetical protein
MIRPRLNDALKAAMKAKDELSVSTLRLILAALKDRDIAARSKGNKDGIADEEVLSLLQSMIKQRRESITAYEKGGRMELAQKEAAEIGIIEGFLPAQMSDDQITAAIDSVIASTGAASLKDMGKAMAALKQQFTGRMDFSKASALVRERLS